jgi:hypothetical protein
MEGHGRGVVQGRFLFQYLPGGATYNHEEPIKDTLYSSPDIIPRLPEYEAGLLQTEATFDFQDVISPLTTEMNHRK